MWARLVEGGAGEDMGRNVLRPGSPEGSVLEGDVKRYWYPANGGSREIGRVICL